MNTHTCFVRYTEMTNIRICRKGQIFNGYETGFALIGIWNMGTFHVVSYQEDYENGYGPA